uniref:Nitrogenase iron protein n=1 Tax=Meloidogyne hapla TaxID=6305 RepID=A0A1I8BL83_MELHA
VPVEHFDELPEPHALAAQLVVHVLGSRFRGHDEQFEELRVLGDHFEQVDVGVLDVLDDLHVLHVVHVEVLEVELVQDHDAQAVEDFLMHC